MSATTTASDPRSDEGYTARGLVAGAGRPVWRAPLLAWAASRLVVFVAAIAGSLWLGVPQGSYSDGAVPGALKFLGSWDTDWYLNIARHGYSANAADVATHFSTFAFFPALPLIMRIGEITGTNPFVWGLVASNLGFLAGLCAIRVLVADLWDERLAVCAVWVSAFLPAATYAGLAYTDGLLFGITAIAALAATRRHWAEAGLLAGVGVLLRPQGVLVVVLVVMLAWTIDGASVGQRLRRSALGIIPGVVALVGFLAWMQHAHGSWSLPFRAQQAWKRTSPGLPALRGLWNEFQGLVTYPFSSDHRAVYEACGHCTSVRATGPARDVIGTILMMALVVALARFVGSWRSPWVIYSALAVLIPLNTGNFNSMLRFGLIAFPLAWPIAAWVSRGGRLRTGWTTAAAIVLMVALTFQIYISPP